MSYTVSLLSGGWGCAVVAGAGGAGFCDLLYLSACAAINAVSWSLKIRHGEKNTSQPYSKIPITPTATRPTPTALLLPMNLCLVRF